MHVPRSMADCHCTWRVILVHSPYRMVTVNWQYLLLQCSTQLARSGRPAWLLYFRTTRLALCITCVLYLRCLFKLRSLLRLCSRCRLRGAFLCLSCSCFTRRFLSRLSSCLCCFFQARSFGMSLAFSSIQLGLTLQILTHFAVFLTAQLFWGQSKVPLARHCRWAAAEISEHVTVLAMSQNIWTFLSGATPIAFRSLLGNLMRAWLEYLHTIEHARAALV